MHIDSHDRGRHHADIRERGVSTSDSRKPEEHMSEMLGFGDILQNGTWIRHHDEACCRLVLAKLLGNAILEVVFENVRLERGARLTRHDKEGLRQIETSFQRVDLSGIGRVEYLELGPALDVAERAGKHIRAQT